MFCTLWSGESLLLLSDSGALQHNLATGNTALAAFLTSVLECASGKGKLGLRLLQLLPARPSLFTVYSLQLSPLLLFFSGCWMYKYS